MSLFTREKFAEPEAEVGTRLVDLGCALLTWTAMRSETGISPTVHDAATTFNTTPELIVEAVEEAMWIYIDGDQLLLDGD